MRFIYKLRSLVIHNRIAVSFAIGLFFIILSKPTMLTIFIGIPVIILGEFLRVLSSGYIEKRSVLIISGPYSIARNPLYFGNFLIGLGFAIISNNPLLIVFFVILFAFIYHSTMAEEERVLEERFGNEFLSYISSVPRFFPRPWKWNNNGYSFDWSLVKKHREYITWMGIIAVILILTFKMVFVA